MTTATEQPEGLRADATKMGEECCLVVKSDSKRGLDIRMTLALPDDELRSLRL